MSRVAPYGSWESPVTTALITRAAVGLGLVDIDGDRLVWTELRPSEGGRTALVEAGLAGEDRRELTPPDLNVRTLVHEYGGGAARAQRGRRFAVSFTDQRPWLLGPGGPVPLGVPGERHADLDLSPDDRWLAAVCERPNADREHENLLRLLPLVEGEPLIIDQGHDFYSSPCFAPDGRSLAYLSWDHPAMPWDGTTLWLVSWDGRRAGMPQRIAGGPGESIFQPSWSPGGALTFVSDRTGWWNLYQLAGDSARPLAPAELEFGRPQWSLGSSLYGHVDERTIVACATESGRDRLLLIDTAAGQIARELEVGLTSIDALRVQAGRVALVGAGARRPTALLLLDLASGALREIASSLSVGLDPGDLSEPEAISFPSEDGATAHAMVDLIFGLNQEKQTTLVLVTHDPDLARKCHRVVRLKGGAVISDDSA